MSEEKFHHQIPLPLRTHGEVKRIASDLLSGRDPIGRVVSMSIRWSIKNGVMPDPRFTTEKNLHVVLSENYGDKYERQMLGLFVHAGVRSYLARFRDVFSAQPGVETWNDDLPASIVYRLEQIAFDQGKALGTIVSQVWTDAVRELRVADENDIQTGEPYAAAYYPTTQEMRADLNRLKAASDKGLYGGNVQDRVCRKMIEIVRRPNWSAR